MTVASLPAGAPRASGSARTNMRLATPPAERGGNQADWRQGGVHADLQ